MLSLARRSLLLGGLALPTLSPVAARAELAPSLRARIGEHMARGRIPGLALTAIRDGKTVFATGFGRASLPFDVAAEDRTLFHLGSIGKHITAALVLRLAEAGKIALDQPIGTYLRDVPPQFASRSVASLLSHTSGIPDYESLETIDGGRTTDRAAFLRAITALQPAFEEGDAWDYSNTGFVLLGYLVADVQGRSYRDQVDNELLRPLGVQEARVDDASAVIARRAEPYVLHNEALQHAKQLDGDYSGWADGGVIMSARDAVRWEAGLRQLRTVSAQGLERMRAPARLKSGRSAGYGAAWQIDRWHGRDVQYHGGAMPGFLGFYLRTERLAVLGAINLSGPEANHRLHRIVFDTAEALQPGSTPQSLRPLPDDTPALTEGFAKLLRRGEQKLDPADFAPEIAVLLSRNEGRKPVPNRSALGDPVSFDFIERFEEPGAFVRRYRAVYKNDRVEYFTVGYATEGKIFRIQTL
jgi:D-alanyl-D-alanine carboxypeptidase